MTLADARAIYSGHFFDRDTMKYWGSRIESDLYKNRCFVTSERNYDGTERYFNVRRFSEDFKNIVDITDFNTIRSIEEARQIIKEVV